jgi:hypothetical protein
MEIHKILIEKINIKIKKPDKLLFLNAARQDLGSSLLNIFI